MALRQVTERALGMKAIRIGSDDETENPFTRLKKNLPLQKYDRLVVETDKGWAEHYCGIYSPLRFPLPARELEVLAQEAATFFIQIGRQILRTQRPSETTIRPPRKSSKHIEKAAVAAVKKALPKYPGS